MQPELGAANPSSDWPFALLLDESWLRVRRRLVHSLEAGRLWPQTRSHETFMREQLVLGDRLRVQLLYDILGSEDHAYLNSEIAFHTANNRLRSRLPLILAFGYSLGESFCTLLEGDKASVKAAAEVGAVFNLGISLFDLMGEEMPDMFRLLTDNFNAETLGALAEEPLDNPFSTEAAETESVLVAEGEVRILSKLIWWFFDQVRARRGRASEELWQTLMAHLAKAHLAETGSTVYRTADIRQWVDISRGKSTLPFHIITDVAALFAEKPPPQLLATAGELTAAIGEVFWQVDDLIDIVDDAQNQSLNSILAVAAEESHDSSAYRALTCTLEGNCIEEAVERVRSSLKSISSRLEQLSQTPEAAKLNGLLASYVRNWME